MITFDILNATYMKFTKYILFLLLTIFIGTAIYIAVQPTDFKIVKTTTIKAPKTVVFGAIKDSTDWQNWSKWDNLTSVKTVQTYGSDSIIQTLKDQTIPQSLVTWNLSNLNAEDTEVTWTLVTEKLDFKTKAALLFKSDTKERMAEEAEQSLELLKTEILKSMSKYTITILGETEYGGGFYMYKTTASTAGNIKNIRAQQLADIRAFNTKHYIKSDGDPFTIYLKRDNTSGNVIMTTAIPVKEKIIVAENSTILCGFMDRTRTVKVRLQGNYTNLPEAWDKAINYITSNGLEASEIKPFEVYSNDPAHVPNPANWITEIYIPLKEEAEMNLNLDLEL